MTLVLSKLFCRRPESDVLNRDIISVGNVFERVGKSCLGGALVGSSAGMIDGARRLRLTWGLEP